MKAVMMSIQPKWVEKILNGEKTIEVRKTAPKLETPFKVYIYCTRCSVPFGKLLRNYDKQYGAYNEAVALIFGLEPNIDFRGKVVAEFTCDKIDSVKPYYNFNDVDVYGINDEILENSCVPYEEICEYSNGKDLYLWHISDLKIYDKPRELGEFYSANQCKDWDKNMDDCVGHGLDYQEKCKQCSGGYIPLTRPPQSWCYVEES